MRLSFTIALRFLKSGKGQTLLIVLGISVGVAVQLFIGSLIQGLQASLIDTTIGSSSHITIVPANGKTSIKDWDRAMYEAGISDSNIINISAAAEGSATIDYDDDTAPVLVRGFKVEDADKIYSFSDGLYEGRLPIKKDEAIIGKDLALKSDTKVNDEITLILPSGTITRLKVTGLFDLEVSSLNDTWVVTTIETAQECLQLMRQQRTYHTTCQ
ncbi:MAG: permease [Sedimentibacter sp.]|nr:permease [Sedimentibacter sp.]